MSDLPPVYLSTSFSSLPSPKQPRTRYHKNYQKRIQFLDRQISHIQKALQTPNATVGQITLDTFMRQTDLNQKVSNYVNRGIESILSD